MKLKTMAMIHHVNAEMSKKGNLPESSAEAEADFPSTTSKHRQQRPPIHPRSVHILLNAEKILAERVTPLLRINGIRYAHGRCDSIESQ